MLYTSSPKTFSPRVITWSTLTAYWKCLPPIEYFYFYSLLFAVIMPRYELALILKAMQRPETAATLRRTVEALMERGAVVRDMENIGERLLPFVITKHNQRHRRGSYFLIDFYAAPSILTGLLDHLHRDVDVVRPTVLKNDKETSKQTCCGPQL
ncbi:28S ribosomal protein S6, mitochondrial [Entelurus aequoreus]|uniref:28S ribosomal protein S6, mitochondrial n=1 Tax=Entelurus aequoreus TaxID=161455 RepID=UPI002B1D5567|nr:28S ribosomal protein S6, mitochondrial [Entelurus aequoreus]